MAIGSSSTLVARSVETAQSGVSARAGRLGQLHVGRLAASLTGFIVPLTLLVVWYIASSTGLLKSYLLPSPATVAATLWELALNGTLAKHIQASVARWMVGFVLGGGLGLLLGSWVGLSRGAERLLDTSVQMLRTVPFLAMAPLLIIWLGLDEAPKIALVGLAAFFPLYINTFAGIRNIDRKLIEVGQIYQLSGAEMLRRVIIPAALPAVFTGVRYGLGVAWLALVVAELMGATRGLGFMLVEGREFVRIDVIVGGILLFSVVGKMVDLFVRRLEAHFLRWRDTYAGG
ncbi:MAG: ABC transporter permease subunit [Chloroflexi bacterium]|nr:ABC transporter permease subunit [Chloroflexota bacterium]